MSYYYDEMIEALKNRGHSEEQIAKMSWQKKFDEFCEWEGLIGYGSRLRGIMAAAKKASE